MKLTEVVEGIVEKLFGKTIETEEFEKVIDTFYIQKRGLSLPGLNSPISLNFKDEIRVYVNPESTISYIEGHAQNMGCEVPDLEPYMKNPEVKKFKEKIDKMFGETDQKRYIAYSICEDKTEIMTGNFFIDEINKVATSGITFKVPSEIIREGMIMRDVRKIDPDKVVGDHKNYTSDLSIDSYANLPLYLTQKYKEMNTFSGPAVAMPGSELSKIINSL